MRISAKGRYAISALVYMADKYYSGELVTVSNVSEFLGISKQYLEQIFAVMKIADIVTAFKGIYGGYYLSKSPDRIFLYDILIRTDFAIFQKTEKNLSNDAKYIDDGMENIVWNILDDTVTDFLKKISVEDITIRLKNSDKVLIEQN